MTVEQWGHWIGLFLVLSASSCAPQGTPQPAPTLTETRAPIVAGMKEEGFPAVGALTAVFDDDHYTGSSCSMTLIAPDWILTAAHCIEGLKNRRPREFEDRHAHFFVGSRATSRDNGVLHQAQRIVVHPGYETPGGHSYYDIALMQLAQPIEDIDPIPIHRADIAERVGSEVFYVGFGVNDGVSGEGGGVKRSAMRTLHNTTPTIYVTAQPDGGVCFGDSGGPGLLWVEDHWEVIGVNSTTFGPVRCLGYSSQVRVDAYRTWIDEVMGLDGDCTAEADACLCEDVCGDEGVCDNAQCGQSECTEAYSCLRRCEEEGCGVQCLLAATPEARYLFEEVSDCISENCANQGGGCAEQMCGREIFGCENGLAAVTGEADCAHIFRCIEGCDGPNCEDRCFFDGSLQAQAQHGIVTTCIERECGELEGDPRDDCVARSCRRLLLLCVPPDDCRLVGGDCEPGYACIPSRWGSTYCRESAGGAIGEACSPQGVECVDGALCVDQGDGGSCEEICTTTSDCGTHPGPCARVEGEGLPFPVGVCGRCADSDDDGSCDEDDCAPDDPLRQPGAEERCHDAVDDDCDDRVDEGCPIPDAGPVDAAVPDAAAPAPDAQPVSISVDRAGPSESGCACDAGGAPLGGPGLWALLFLLAPRRRRLDRTGFGTAAALTVIIASLFLGGCVEEEERPRSPAPSADAADVVDGEVDSVMGDLDGGVDGGDPLDAAPDALVVDAATGPVTIVDIQSGVIATGTEVTLAEALVSSPVVDGSFYVSDAQGGAFSGLWVASGAMNLPELSLGDALSLEGVVANLDTPDAGGYGRTTLLLTAEPEVMGEGELPMPQSVTPAELAIMDLAILYEGVAVSLRDAAVTRVQASRSMLILDGLVSLSALFVDIDFGWLSVGRQFEEVVGLLHFTANGLHLAPRSDEGLTAPPSMFGDCIPAQGYALCLQGQRWGTARRSCAELGGRLVVLETAEENIALGALMRTWHDGDFWIGLSDRAEEGDWRWLDGSEVAYEDGWADGEPNDYGNGEDCAESNWGDDARWNDAPCGGEQPYVCEFPSPGVSCVDDAPCGESGTCVDGDCRPPMEPEGEE